jgi:hypothetical protein
MALAMLAAPSGLQVSRVCIPPRKDCAVRTVGKQDENADLDLKVEINRTDTVVHGCAWGAYTVTTTPHTCNYAHFTLPRSSKAPLKTCQVYEIDISCSNVGTQWTMCRRFQDFVELRDRLHHIFTINSSFFPTKVVVGSRCPMVRTTASQLLKPLESLSTTRKHARTGPWRHPPSFTTHI